MKACVSGQRVLAFLAVSVLAGCGGGGGGDGSGSNSRENHPPVASAGSAATVNKAAMVTLDASASSDVDGDSLVYKWRQTSGTPVTLSSSSGSKPTFTAPSQSGPLVFGVVVNDGRVDSPEATVTITVQDRTPIANAGQPATVASAVNVMLDGSASSDPDGDSLTYAWVQVSGPTVQLTSSDTSHAAFTAPAGSATLLFELTVSDGEQAAKQTVQVTVDARIGNSAPIANAGFPQTLPKGSTVFLDGSGMDPEGRPVTYHWDQVSGPAVTLQYRNSPYPYFTALQPPAVYVFSLTVNDGVQDSAPSNVTITIQNYAPSLYGVVLSPGAPKTADDLTVGATVYDADNDTVVVSYVWKRNGVVLPGHSTPTLAASDTAKGDVIAVTVTANDGTVQVTQDATTTILDTQAVLATNAPTHASYGDSISFQVSGSDADGDPITGYEVAYGPAGLGVSSSGLVSWHAVGPMFDRAQDFNWGIRLHNQPESLVSGTIGVSDATRVYPLRRTGLDMPIARSGLVVGDLDGDGAAETLALSFGAVYEAKHSGSTYVQTWSYPFGGAPSGPGDFVYGAVAAGDVNGDHKQEIFFTDAHVLVMLDGVNRRESHRRDLGNETCAKLIVADVDVDGTPDLLCLAAQDLTYLPQHLLVLRAADLSLEWELKNVALGGSMAVGNVDNDPALEIVTGNGYVYDGASHQNEWAYGPGFGDPVAVGNVDGTGRDEIVGNAASVGSTTAGVNVYSAVTKSLLAFIPESDGVGALVVSDLDNDGKAEILLGGLNWSGVTTYSYDTGSGTYAQLWSLSSTSIPLYASTVSSMAVGDVDGDGSPDVVWGAGIGSGGNRALFVSSTIAPVAFEYYPSNPIQLGPLFTGASLTRIGGGARRLVFHSPFNDGSGVGGGDRLVGLDPLTGRIEVGNVIDSNWLGSKALTVADFDGDGVDDVCVGTASTYDGYYAEYDFATSTRKWASASGLGGAMAMTHADVKGNGTEALIAVRNSYGYVDVYDTQAQTLLWRSPQLNTGGVDVEAVDVDNDGKVDIVELASNQLVIYSRDSTPSGYSQRYSATLPDSGVDLVVADTDGDGQAEIYVLNVPTLQKASILAFDNKLQLQRSFAPDVYATSLSLEQSSFARKNLVLTVTSDRNAIQFPYDKSRLWIIDPVTGVPVWKSPEFVGDVPINSVTFPDIDGDGVPEIAMGTNSGMYLTR